MIVRCLIKKGLQLEGHNLELVRHELHEWRQREAGQAGVFTCGVGVCLRDENSEAGAKHT